ncbi:MAG: FGGY family carbohydrate kinase [Pseudomonadales bacterium]
MAPPYVLVLDQGGHGSRALVFDAVGCVVASASVTVSTHFPAVGCVEQSPTEILQSLRDVIATVAAQLGDRCKAIEAAALIVQRSSLVALDELSGVALSPILSWQDTGMRIG